MPTDRQIGLFGALDSEPFETPHEQDRAWSEAMAKARRLREMPPMPEGERTAALRPLTDGRRRK